MSTPIVENLQKCSFHRIERHHADNDDLTIAQEQLFEIQAPCKRCIVGLKSPQVKMADFASRVKARDNTVLLGSASRRQHG